MRVQQISLAKSVTKNTQIGMPHLPDIGTIYQIHWHCRGSNFSFSLIQEGASKV